MELHQKIPKRMNIVLNRVMAGVGLSE